MEQGSRYVVYSQDTLYMLHNSQCNEGDSVTLNNNIVTRFRFVNGHLLGGDEYLVNNYSSTTYICHIYNDSLTFNPNYLVLPATIIMLCFLSIIFHWFLRLRG